MLKTHKIIKTFEINQRKQSAHRWRRVSWRATPDTRDPAAASRCLSTWCRRRRTTAQPREARTATRWRRISRAPNRERRSPTTRKRFPPSTLRASSPCTCEEKKNLNDFFVDTFPGHATYTYDSISKPFLTCYPKSHPDVRSLLTPRNNTAVYTLVNGVITH